MLFADSGDHLLPSLLVGRILHEKCGFSTGFANRLGRRLARILVDIGQHDRGTFAGENLGIGSTQTRCRACNQCHFSLDSTHCSPLFVFLLNDTPLLLT